MELLRSLIGPDNGDASAAQLCVRAVILFAFGVACIRIGGRRMFSQVSPLDIVVAIVVGSNISRAMTGKAPFWPALAATLLLAVLHRLLSWAAARWRPLSWLIKGRPTCLVENGRIDRAALARAGVSEDDLVEALRMEGVASVEETRLAFLEGGGKISVVPVKR
jgi:uncharacterized membrane protein YcaP (DUF421 family)